MFRWQFPKPGQEQEHEDWKRWVLETQQWPSENQLEDQSYQILMPTAWRRRCYQSLTNFEQFADMKRRRRWSEGYGGYGGGGRW